MPKTNDQPVLLTKYFFDNFPVEMLIGNREPANKQEELAKKYLNLIMEIFDVFDRLCRYEKYFHDFLPSKKSNISVSEAIEYHLRNYVQEFYILRERIQKICNYLIIDLKNYKIINKEDIVNHLEGLKMNVDTNFKKINDELRRGHVHDKSITDNDLVKGKFLHKLISGEIRMPSGEQLDVPQLELALQATTEKSKIKYYSQATNNSVGLKKAKQFFSAVFGTIFAEINRHDSKGFDLTAHLK